jgi:hypothetical protein
LESYSNPPTGVGIFIFTRSNFAGSRPHRFCRDLASQVMFISCMEVSFLRAPDPTPPSAYPTML